MYAIVFVLLVSFAWAECPTVVPKPDLNITEYTRATWYIQWQQVTGYLPENTFYCVLATYVSDNPWVPLKRKSLTVSVHNYNNEDKVNGVNGNFNNQTLCARQTDPSKPAELLVAPCFLPNALAGPYWIVAAGPEGSAKYEWAIVSGGQPDVEYSDGCTTKEDGVNGSGFWFFTRKQNPSKETISNMFKVAVDLGYTVQRLKQVEQEGCLYEGAMIVPDE